MVEPALRASSRRNSSCPQIQKQINIIFGVTKTKNNEIEPEGAQQSHSWTTDCAAEQVKPAVKPEGKSGEPVTEEDLMVAFTERARATPHPGGVHDIAVDKQVRKALKWSKRRSAQEEMDERERRVEAIENRARELRRTGEVGRWLAEADPKARAVAAGVNGPLLLQLAQDTRFTDCDCVDTLRYGAAAMGDLKGAADSTPHEYPPAECTEALKASCKERNKKLVASLRKDPHADFLQQQTEEDVQAGRMVGPYPVETLDLDKVLLGRRFSREQGTKPDGSTKLRAVDDETANGCNKSARPTAMPRADTVDKLLAVLVMFQTRFGIGTSCALWKADIDSAYRRVPVREADRWALWIAFLVGGTAMAAGHNAMPFGSIGSVHAWDRIGALLRHIGRIVLRIPLMRYVDDFFSVARAEVAEHSMMCFARLVRALLGEEAVAPRKLEAGNPLVILGLRVTTSPSGATVQVDTKKADEWTKKLTTALHTGVLSAGDASKMAGRLALPGGVASSRVSVWL